MRTTIEIPDASFRVLRKITAECGMSVKEFVLQAVHERLAQIPQHPKGRRTVKLPLILSKLTGTIPSMTNADIEGLVSRGT